MFLVFDSGNARPAYTRTATAGPRAPGRGGIAGANRAAVARTRRATLASFANRAPFGPPAPTRAPFNARAAGGRGGRGGLNAAEQAAFRRALGNI